MKRYLQSSYKLLSFVFFLSICEGVALYVDNSLLFPRLYDIYSSLKNILNSPEFFSIIWNTMSRLILSIVLSIIGAIFFASLSYISSFISVLIKPFIIFLRTVPTITMIILVLIWSSTEKVPIFVGMVILFPILYENILGALKSVDQNLLKMSKVYNVPLNRIITNIYIPSVYYSIFSNFPSYIGLTFKVVIAGEILSQENFSIGGEIFLNKIYLESSNIFAWIIIVIVINYFLEKGLKYFNTRVNRGKKWK